VQTDKFGFMTALKGKSIEPVPLSVVATSLKTVDETYDVARVFFP
jgi:hypothetical protein